MDLKERASYIMGLLEGSKLDFSKEENKILKSLADLMQKTTEKIYELEQQNEENSILIDELDEDLANVEQDLYSGEDFGCCAKEGCDCSHEEMHHEGEKEENYEISCPECGRTVELNDDIFEKEDMVCPECGKKIEFDFDGND